MTTFTTQYPVWTSASECTPYNSAGSCALDLGSAYGLRSFRPRIHSDFRDVNVRCAIFCPYRPPSQVLLLECAARYVASHWDPVSRGRQGRGALAGHPEIVAFDSPVTCCGLPLLRQLSSWLRRIRTYLFMANNSVSVRCPWTPLPVVHLTCAARGVSS